MTRKKIYLYDAYFHNRKLTPNEMSYLERDANNPVDDQHQKRVIDHAITYDQDEADSDCESDREYGNKNVYFRKTDDPHKFWNNSTERRYVSTLFGKINEDGVTKSIAVNVLNYYPRFQVGLPQSIQDLYRKDRERGKKMAMHFRNKCVTYLSRSVKKRHRGHDLLEEASLIKGINCVGFKNGEQDLLLELKFRNSNVRKSYFWTIKYTRCVINGSDIYFIKVPQKIPISKEEQLTIYSWSVNHKYTFYHDSKGIFKPAGLMLLSKYVDTGEYISLCDYEVSITYDALLKVNEDCDQHHFTKDELPTFTSISWDIETYANNSRRQKEEVRLNEYRAQRREELEKEYGPLSHEKFIDLLHDERYNREIDEIMSKIVIHPNIDKNDTIFSIGLSIVTSVNAGVINNPHQMRNIVLTLNKCSRDKLVEMEDDINLTVIECTNEQELLVRFIDIFREVRPDFSYTHNGMKYDWKWIYERSKKYGIERTHYAKLGKMNHMKSRTNERGGTATKQLGRQSYVYPKLIGIVDIDTLKYFGSMASSKLKSLKLSWLCGHYFKNDFQEVRKKGLTYKEMYEHIRKSYVNPDGEIEKIGIFDVVYYNIYDCICLHYLVDRCNILHDNIAAAKINNMSMSEYLNRGVTLKVLVKFTETAINRGYYIPHRRQTDNGRFTDIMNIFPETREEFDRISNNTDIELQEFVLSTLKGAVPKGGYVQCREDGSHENITCIDVKSMYPNLIKAYNLCPTTWINDDTYITPDVKYREINWEQKDERVRKAKFVQNNSGILPDTLTDLLNLRADIKRKMKKFIKDTIASGKAKDYTKVLPMGEYKILDSQQLQVKILCNSCYGALLYKNFDLYVPDIGGSVTQTGRDYIQHAGRIAENDMGLEIIYGDTDSIFTRVPESAVSRSYPNPDYNPNEPSIQNVNQPFLRKSPERLFNEIWDVNKELEEHINKIYHDLELSDLVVELEKQFTRLHIFRKKKYAGIKCEKRDINKYEYSVMGIDFKKRSATLIDRYVGKGILYDIILDGKPRELIITFIKDLIHDIYKTDKFGPEYFKKTIKFKGFEAYKKPDSLPFCRAVKIINELDAGNLIMAGDSIDYTFYKVPVKYGSRGGRILPKKGDQIWPFDYIDRRPNFEFDYFGFVKQSLSRYYSILMKLLSVNRALDVDAWLLEEFLKYDSSIISLS